MRNQGVRRSGVVSVVLVLLFSMSLVSQGVSAFESELMPCEVLRGLRYLNLVEPCLRIQE